MLTARVIGFSNVNEDLLYQEQMITQSATTAVNPFEESAEFITRRTDSAFRQLTP